MSTTPHHNESRDPIMEDDHFSLKFGNPIQVIHDTERHKVDNFEPTKEHVTGSLASSIGDAIATHKKEHQKPPLKQHSSSSFRDWSSCSDFFHNKNGSVSEIEHKD
ncbi:uncharacterized protein B0P05DRAFT_553582 [Gilbertella persicaria]|uniref:uncharacterized protein n=1 Tax=Gilbertella persicaria TaxID=101096 RepID=UPI00221E5BF1|nr:uncharacterized protein B0P05DRAFT_553582 [Gilbertella persicaria]KAI8066255.1 hypothetical protein B0P05DRAFT_553582 [Gilbertella persicaria]